MNDLNESELLLLSNYAYFSCSCNDGTIKENIDRMRLSDGSFDIEKIRAQGATGDIISEEDAVDILERLSDNEKLSGLHTARKVNEGKLRAVLYADESGKQATLVFRGTGGTYKAWHDNVTGEYMADTNIQKVASDFVKYECSGFNDIVVTGHSKGGNLAQYATIVCGSQISRCVSFDGQGFGEKAIKEHKEEIESAKDKITCINGYNDFVNILLTPIAGEILYVRNQAGISIDMHSCYTMLSNGVFDKNGNFDRKEGLMPQPHLMKMAQLAGDGIVTVMDSLPDNGNEKASAVLASWVASIFSADMGEEFESDNIARAIGEFKAYSKELIGINAEDEIANALASEYLCMYVNKARNVYDLLDDIVQKLYVYPDIIDDISERLGYDIAGRSFTGKALKKISDKICKTADSIGRMRDALTDIISFYEKADVISE